MTYAESHQKVTFDKARRAIVELQRELRDPTIQVEIGDGGKVFLVGEIGRHQAYLDADYNLTTCPVE